MARSLRAQAMECNVGFPGDVAGGDQEPDERHRGENTNEEGPAIE
jgi:hypothetical protein